MQLIRVGSAGERVRDVQARLAALGHAIPSEERGGAFGDGTRLAVLAFQQARGLIVDGIVGPDTWRQLVEASWRLGDRLLYLRSPNLRGDDVRALQDVLARLGFDVGRVDGIFGPQAHRCVEEFQRNYGLPVDGIVGEATVRAFHGLPPIAGTTPAGTLREREALRARPRTLAELRIVIDPAHGGSDPGHIGPAGLREDEWAFAIARGLEAALAAGGARVFLTRSATAGPSDRERATLANRLNADLFLSLHLGCGDPGARGAAAFYFGHERFHSESGLLLAEAILDEIRELGIVDARAHAKTFAVLRETRMTAVMIEAGHVSNPDEEALLADPAFHARIVEAIAQAVRRFAREPLNP